jgi:hypothetical protein
MSTEQKTIQSFINSIVNKDYAQAKINLQNAVAEKLKTKIRNYVGNN